MQGTLLESRRTAREGEAVARRKASQGGTKGRSRRKSSAPKELSAEEEEALARLRRDVKKKGVWEVTLDDGVVVGLFEGTPQRIGAWVAAQQQVAPKALYFQRMKIRDVPEEISKDKCCDRKFQRKDNFCPMCGQPRAVEPSIPESIHVEVYTDAG